MDKFELPMVEKLNNCFSSGKRLLVLSEGFEERSLSYINECRHITIDKIILCKYSPIRKSSKYEQIRSIILSKFKNSQITILEFDRFNPLDFEVKFHLECSKLDKIDEIIIDISVMSKYLIMQIFCTLSNYTGKIRIVYAEPFFHAPSEEEYNRISDKLSNATILPDEIAVFPSFGVHNVIRTPLLTSIVMQKSPVLLLAFLSFNEQLIRSLLLEFSPMHLYLINGVSSYYQWKEKAMADIHRYIRKEYQYDNPLDLNGYLQRKSNMLNYIETFDLLASIYREKCIDYRIVLAPTGTKMQTLGCALIKLCCPDIHIEYPIPESYYIDGYSSSAIRQIHQVVFNNLPELIRIISEQYQLNG
jgi:hypothetical protein